MIDLCMGPHIPNTGKIKAMMVTKVRLPLHPLEEPKTHPSLKNSSSYFLGDQNNDTLQRLWGISFPESKQLTEHKEFLAEAAKRDHRKIGKVLLLPLYCVPFHVDSLCSRNKNFSSSTN